MHSEHACIYSLGVHRKKGPVEGVVSGEYKSMDPRTCAGIVITISTNCAKRRTSVLTTPCY